MNKLDKFAWIRQPREGRSSTMYSTRYAFPPMEKGWVEEVAVVDINDEETKRLIRSFNDLVHKHRVAPAQTVPHDGRRIKIAALQEEAHRELGILDVNEFMKNTVWPFCRQGGDLDLVGFHYFENFLPKSVKHEDVEAAVLPEQYVWEDNDAKHQQNREVCTHGVTLLDREQLNPAECAPLPLPPLVAQKVVPRLQRHLDALDLPCDLDFLYANRYRKAKGGYIRFHHDQLTKMGPVVVGVSLGATAHMSFVRTCTPDTKLPGSDGSVEVEMAAGSMYVMSGISRYALKHGVLDASSRGDRVSLTFREVTKASDAEGKRRWKRNASEISGPMVKHPAALGCKCCLTSKVKPTKGNSRLFEDAEEESRRQRSRIEDAN
jgi:alkylated DNA repair dioxygenase AlkB